jgi:hypothetical protein
MLHHTLSLKGLVLLVCRSVLGIINRGGTMAEYITLPAANLHEVRA